jgi:hypothetical protein
MSQCCVTKGNANVTVSCLEVFCLWLHWILCIYIDSMPLICIGYCPLHNVWFSTLYTCMLYLNARDRHEGVAIIFRTSAAICTVVVVAQCNVKW